VTECESVRVVWGCVGRGGRSSSGCGLVPGWCVCGAGVVGYVAQETSTAVDHTQQCARCGCRPRMPKKMRFILA